jgi:hypothetical protein
MSRVLRNLARVQHNLLVDGCNVGVWLGRKECEEKVFATFALLLTKDPAPRERSCYRKNKSTHRRAATHERTAAAAILPHNTLLPGLTTGEQVPGKLVKFNP